MLPDDKLDQALEMTFPASDPVAMDAPLRVGRGPAAAPEADDEHATEEPRAADEPREAPSGAARKEA